MGTFLLLLFSHVVVFVGGVVCARLYWRHAIAYLKSLENQAGNAGA